MACSTLAQEQNVCGSFPVIFSNQIFKVINKVSCSIDRDRFEQNYLRRDLNKKIKGIRNQQLDLLFFDAQIIIDPAYLLST